MRLVDDCSRKINTYSVTIDKMGEPHPVQIGPPEASTTVTVEETVTENAEVPTLKLKLVKPKSDRKVKWTSETVDNEDLNKKKSKCCCIYTKPKVFGESSSDSSDDECDHCKGHMDKKKKRAHYHCDPNSDSCELPRAATSSNATQVNNEDVPSNNANSNPDSNLNQ